MIPGFTHGFTLTLILMAGSLSLSPVMAVTDAELEALEKQINQQEAEEKQRIEAEKEARRKAEIEAEKKRLQELEQKKLAEEKRKEEEARLAELERQREQEALKNKYTLIMTEADKALSDKYRELAIRKYQEALALFPNDGAATLGLKYAESLKHKLCYEVMGKWIWDKAFGQDTMILLEDGSIDYQTTIKGSGSWECTNPENRTIKIRLSAAGFSNEWLSTYSKDGSCLTGPPAIGEPGCYHRPPGETRATEQSSESLSTATRTGETSEMKAQANTSKDTCKQLVGIWQWNNGSRTWFHEDGEAKSTALIIKSAGNWECVDPEKRIFSFNTWDKKREIKMSEDGNRIESIDAALGVKITAEKISNDPDQEIVPEKKQDTSIFGQ